MWRRSIRAFGEEGFIEGKNVVIEYRWAGGDYDRMGDLARDLVARNVAVIAATGDVSSARAAQSATTKTPIVFTIGGDPVRFGLVASYSRPGGNITGISLISSVIGAKRVELLHDIAPGAKIGLLMNPDNPNAAAEQRDTQQAAQAMGHQTVVLNVRNKQDFPAAFDAFVRERARALFVATDPMLLSQRDPLVQFAAQQRVPAIYFVREFVVVGGLVSYGASIREMYRQAGVYAGRDPERGQAGRAAGPAAHDRRADRQSQDREGTQHQPAADSASSSQRADRMSRPGRRGRS